MIIYQSTKDGFLNDAFGQDIEGVVLGAYQARTGHRVAKSEVRAWKGSLLAMAKVLRHESIPDDCGVAIEYVIPQTAKRIDLLLSGIDEQNRSKLIIVELKQWETAALSHKDGLVRTRFAGGESDTSHPSYQAWSYAELLRNFNEEVYSRDIPLQPCAYLHNFVDGAILNDAVYQPYVEKAPIFLAGQTERERLRAFIARHVRRGDRGNLIVQIENGRIRPSRRLIDALVGMLEGKREFVLVDDQKVAYETVVAEAVEASEGAKRVIIIDGGPGTGKSV
ncbi:MAG: ATP-binding protein, partial [Proteobacteria bacterium]|nr:ATP-binding protein [Pseudomonadota bacterium]